jgi:uncharacterized protein YecE (DUF72 family)
MSVRARCRVRVGCAGWSIPRIAAARFAGEGTHLQRYAGTLDAVEINSSFYRPHATRVYERWAASTPRAFRFAVKVPREITHEHALDDVDVPLGAFLDQVAGLGARLGPLLVQLPPKLEADLATADRFFRTLRARFEGDVACEPRHPSWCAPAVDRLLVDHQVARVAADPPAGGCSVPGGWGGLRYLRLHGSPDVYWSTYEDERLAALEASIRAYARTAPVWCVFDNTAAGAASLNALDLLERLTRTPPERATGAVIAPVSDRRPP